MNRIQPVLQFATLFLAISPLALFAAEPATQPTVDLNGINAPAVDIDSPTGLNDPAPPSPPVPGDDKKITRRDRMFPRMGQRPQPPTDKEIADAMQFMSQHSKNRFDAIESMPEGNNKAQVEATTTSTYLNWMRIAAEDSELYAVVLKRVSLEDEIFGKVTQLKKTADADAQKPLMDELKTDVGQLLDIGLQERKLRLDRLTKTIKNEQKQLDDDSANRAALVDDRLKAILKTSNTNNLVPSSGIGEGKGAGNGGGGGGDKHGHGGAPRP